MVAEWEYSYNGLTFGGATDFGVQSVEGLSPPDSRESVIEKAESHGSFIYAPFVTERRITFEGDILAEQRALSLPSDIDGLVMWLKADAITGLVNNDPVTTWEDQSASGANDVTQATAGFKPVYKTNIINGKPVVRFDGTDDFLQIAKTFDVLLGSDDSPWTIIVVFKSSSINDGILCGATGWDHGLMQQGATSVRAQLFNAARTEAFQSDVGGLNQTAFHIATGRSEGPLGSLTAFLNGIADATPATLPGDVDQSGWNVSVGGLENLKWFNGDIAEVLFFNHALTNKERQQVEYYLAQKYALTGFAPILVSDLEDKVNQWRTAFGPRKTTLALKVKLEGDEQKHINCVPVKRAFTVNPDYSRGFAAWMLQLLAEDPRFYAEVLKSESLANGVTEALVNGGTAPTYPVVTFVGPCSNPVILLEEDPPTLIGVGLTANLGSGQERIIDFAARTIVDEDGNNRYSELRLPVELSFLGSELLTPTNPSGLIAGAISGDTLILNAENEAGGSPPNSGIVLPGGSIEALFDIEIGGALGVNRLEYRVRNITTSTTVISAGYAQGAGRRLMSLEFNADGTSAYQAQVVAITTASDIRTIHSVSFTTPDKSGWWELSPGSNNVLYKIATGSTTATIEWRDAWL
jgi:hypothetical protein